jgi:hypothetical protein
MCASHLFGALTPLFLRISYAKHHTTLMWSLVDCIRAIWCIILRLVDLLLSIILGKTY